MANELYRSQVIVDLGWKRSTLTFFWIAANLLLEDGYHVAQGINNNLNAGLDWLYTLSGCIGSQCRIVQLRTRRISPAGSATFVDQYPIGTVPGRLVGTVQQSWTAARLQWHTADDRTGKLGVRLGPLPAGMFQDDGWYITFVVNVDLFVTQHVLPRSTASGVDFQSAVQNGDGTASAITSGTLGWPHSRQLNRRMPF